ncbi:hypothetical protein OPT61_g1155 [Boeremia exigua]|uniref:Uncharacterized protein n=1 Tax=Boeremia exigua TaxID=749465 RepID=A0ACC2IRE4_9PLEO|nr:hypothetical protein OPT61_g1155 [Boeremia exigua]
MSVLIAEEGKIKHLSDVLDEMRERFMIHGSRLPFNWVLRLRAYGKKIINSSTSLGYIYWSDDHERLTYKQLELSIADFKKFVATQVALAQSELEQLFLIHSDETREDVIPAFKLRDLKDDPTESAKGWSFCKDVRNKDVLPEGKRRMLDRVLQADALRAEFTGLRKKDSKLKGDASWISTCLSNALKEEARTHLQTHLNITYYRHVAIAISRVYIKSGGFKRDYGIEEKTLNDQASYTTWKAGSIYARGLEEAPRAIEARRAEYWIVSREWHSFLGFCAYLPCTKRPALFNVLDEEGTAAGSRKKQRCAWAGLIEYASKLEVPSQVIKPIQELPVPAANSINSVRVSCLQLGQIKSYVQRSYYVRRKEAKLIADKV